MLNCKSHLIESQSDATYNLPSTLTSVYLYTLNSDGSITALNSNEAVGPLTATYTTDASAGNIITYTDASGNVVLKAQATTTGSYQVDTGFISYSTSAGYILVSNDQITDTSTVTWANQSGQTPTSTGYGYPGYAGVSTSLVLTDSSTDTTLTYDKVSGGANAATGYYDPTAHAATTTTYNLPSTLTDVYLYTLNNDGSLTALNSNEAVGPLTATYTTDATAGTIVTYTDASGNVVLKAQATTTGSYQVDTGFISYSVSGGYLLVSNDKIDTSTVTWANQDGGTPTSTGYTSYPAYAGASTSLVLTDSSTSTTTSYAKVAGGTSAATGYYDPTAHATVATSPYVFPTTIPNVYIYNLNNDGTISTTNDNEPVGPLTGTYDTSTNPMTLTYTDASGNVVLKTQATTLGSYQADNSFIAYSVSGGYVLVSNDPILDTSTVSWANQDGGTPATVSTSYPAFAGYSTSLVISSTDTDNTNNTITYTKVASGSASTTTVIYDVDTHVEMPCFLAGTMILTNQGYKAVEFLDLEDYIAVIQQGEVKWSRIKALSVGKRQVTQSPFPDVAGYPVRIKAGAISPGVPFKDMLVTNDHAIFIDGKLVLARMLVDDEKICYDRDVKEYSFYHIDLFDHMIIDANGVQVESFNSKDHNKLFGNAAVKENTSLTFDRSPVEMDLCLNPSEIYDIRKKLELKDKKIQVQENVDGISFHLIDPLSNKIEKRLVGKNLYSFTIPPHIDTVNLVSETHRPCDLIGPHVDDRRKLGLLVGDVTLIEKEGLIKHEDHLTEASSIGWSGIENSTCRWTTGNAVLKVTRKYPENAAVLLIKVMNDAKGIG